jgi:mRNA interferase HigB
MRIVSKTILLAFAERNKDAKQPLLAWIEEARHAEWKTPQDIKAQYRSASIIANNRVVFNIKANDYRLIVGVSYKHGGLYVKFIGTHAAYDKVDAATVELEE